MKKNLVSFIDVCKFYQMGDTQITAANKMSFQINEGEFCVVIGPSGAGKTTLLNILGGMDNCDSGKVVVDELIVSSLNNQKLTEYRRHYVGFVFQFYNLIGNLTALENIEIASEICKEPLDSKYVLELVGLSERINNFPSQLSGGEQQRVSIARALAKNPKILLCDEPTGALDYQTGKSVLKILQDTCRKTSKTIIIVTHNTAIAKMADRIIKVKNGTIDEIIINSKPLPVEEVEW